MVKVVELSKPKNRRVHTLVRLNDELSETIKASAEKNFRSLAQEIQFRLKRDMDANHG